MEEFQHVAAFLLYSLGFGSLAQSYILRYFCIQHSDSSKHLFLFILKFATRIEYFDL